MPKLIKLDKDSTIKIAEKMENYLNPDFLYVPLPPKKSDVKRVKKIKKYDHFYGNLYSPISGSLHHLENVKLPSGKDTMCMVYENDFQEKREIEIPIRKKIDDLTKSEVISSILSKDLVKELINFKEGVLLVSGIDDEPYIENEAFLERKFTKQIIDTIELFLHVFPIDKAFIVLKNTDSKTIYAYQNLIGMYQNIELKLVDDYFLIGKEEFLKDYLHLKSNTLYLKTSDVYEVYVNLKKRIPNVEKYITISGNGVKKPLVIKTKIGVKVVDIFNKYFNEDFSNAVFYTNGMMQGQEIDISDLIVTKDLDGIIVMKRVKRNPKKCIKCGKCISICPLKMNPYLAYKLGIKLDCLKCGLCTYICPSYIPLQRYLGGDSDE